MRPATMQGGWLGDAYIQRSAVIAEFCQALGGRGVAFVGDVVGGACKPIDSGYRRAQARRAQPAGDREIFIVIDAVRSAFEGAAGMGGGRC